MHQSQGNGTHIQVLGGEGGGACTSLRATKVLQGGGGGERRWGGGMRSLYSMFYGWGEACVRRVCTKGWPTLVSSSPLTRPLKSFSSHASALT